MFKIDWLVPNEEWAIAKRAWLRYPPGSSPDINYDLRLQVLEGPVQFTYDGDQLFPTGRLWEIYQRWQTNIAKRRGPTREMLGPDDISGRGLSIADLAIKLARFLKQDTELSSGEASHRISQADAQITLFFEPRGDHMVIRSDLFDDIRLAVPKSEFFPVVRQFLIDFATLVREQAPYLFEWHSFSSLRDYLPE